MKIQMKAKKIPGSLISETAYALTAATDITENTRWEFYRPDVSQSPDTMTPLASWSSSSMFSASDKSLIIYDIMFLMSIPERFSQRASPHPMCL